MADVLPIRPLYPLASPPATTVPLVVDASSLAVLLSCSVRTVRTWDAAGRLPAAVRIGGRVVWRMDEILRWLDAGCPERETWAAREAARRK